MTQQTNPNPPLHQTVLDLVNDNATDAELRLQALEAGNFWTPVVTAAPALLNAASVAPYPLTITNTLQKQNILSAGPLAYTISPFVILPETDNQFRGFSVENLSPTVANPMTGAVADASPFTGTPVFGVGFSIYETVGNESIYVVGDVLGLYSGTNIQVHIEPGDTITGRSITFAYKLTPNGGNVDIDCQLMDSDTNAVIVTCPTIVNVPAPQGNLGIGVVVETSDPQAQFDRHFDKIATGVQQVEGGEAIDPNQLPDDGAYIVTGLNEPALSNIGTVLNGMLAVIENGVLASKTGVNDYVYAAGDQEVYGTKNFINGLLIDGKPLAAGGAYTPIRADGPSPDYPYGIAPNVKVIDVTQTYPGPGALTLSLLDNTAVVGDTFEFVAATSYTNSQIELFSQTYNMAYAPADAGSTTGPITVRAGYQYTGRLVGSATGNFWQLEERALGGQKLFDNTYVTQATDVAAVNLGLGDIGKWMVIDLSNVTNSQPVDVVLPQSGQSDGDKIIVSFDPSNINAFVFGNWPVIGSNLFVGGKSTYEFTWRIGVGTWEPRQLSA